MLLSTTLMLASCAGTGSGGTAMTAIYSPPVALGGAGSMIFLPRTVRKIPPSLERADATPVPTNPAWLAGTWIPDAGPGDLERIACASDRPITYKTDGTYWSFEADGRWTLKGDRVTEVLTEVYESADDDLRGLVGIHETHAIRRVGPDEALVIYRDGSSMAMLRCRPGDILP